MPNNAATPTVSVKKFVKLYEEIGSIKGIARHLDLPWHGVQASYERAVAEGQMDPIRPGRKSRDHLTNIAKGKVKAKVEEPVVGGKLRATEYAQAKLRKRGVTRFLFTCAQNNTKLFDAFWDNLLVFREHVGAKLHVSRFAYIKTSFGAAGDKAAWLGNEKVVRSKDFWFDPRIVPYISDNRMEVAPGLAWCGDQNIIPTAARPLSGFETYTGRASGIFPHTKFAMDSIATVNAEEPTKFNYTTGAVTLRNYIARKEGLKAEFHHCYGALLVEVDDEGSWWVRQINADSEGSFYEIDPAGDGVLMVKHGEITTGHRIEAITAGDSHMANADPDAVAATWGHGGMVPVLNPKYQFIHDVIDFESRSHHDMKNPHRKFLLHKLGREDVKQEVRGVVNFLSDISRQYPDTKTVVVDSNHDRHIARWLAEQNGLLDPVNSQFWLDLQRATYVHMAEHGEEPNHLQLAVRLIAPKMERENGVVFLPEDGSFIICHDNSGGIECALHGDRGPNGSRGSAKGLSRMGRKANIGHSHSCAIVDGVYQSGTLSLLKLDYNKGPSSWSHTNIITYPNGKRALVTIWEGRWRA